MVTVTFEELELNAVLASLDARVQKMSRTLARLSDQAPSRSRDFAIDCTREAIRHALLAQLTVAAAIDEPDYPADMTVTAAGGTWTVIEHETELRAAWGDR